MLTVDRHERAATAGDGLAHQRAGHDERLLVGKGHALAGRERGERGVEARGTDDGIEHHVDVRVHRSLDERRGAQRPSVARVARRALHQPDV